MHRNKEPDEMLENDKMHKSSISNYGISYSRIGTSYTNIIRTTIHPGNYGESALGVRDNGCRARTVNNA